MRLGPRGVRRLVVAAVALAGLVALIVMRAPIAEAVGKRVLAWGGVEAEFSLSALDLNRAVIENVRIGPADSPGIAARRVETRYSPWGVLSGRVRAITVEGLEVRLAVDAAGARVIGLSLGGGGGGGGGRARAPMISVPDGLLYVETEAGELIANVAVVGDPEEGWSAQVSAYPAILARGASSLELAAGDLDVVIAEGEVHVAAELRLAEATGAGVRAEDAAAQIRFDGELADMARLDGLVGEGEASFSLGGGRVEPEVAAAWAERVAPAPPAGLEDVLGGHAAALRGAIVEALGGLSGRADLVLAVADGRLAATPGEEAALAGAGGAEVAVVSASGKTGTLVYEWDTGALSARDIGVTAALPGGLDARMIVETGSVRRGERGYEGEAATNLALAPWSVAGLSLSGVAEQARLDFQPGAWRLETAAELRATGAAEGVEVEDLVATLDLAVEAEENRLTASPMGEAVQRIQAERITAAGRTLELLDAGLSPLASGGALLTIEDGAGRFETRLSDASAGMEAFGSRWAAQLPAAEFAAGFGPGDRLSLRAYIQAPRVEGRSAPQNGGGAGTSVIQASVIDGAAELGDARSARLRVEGLSAGGSALPVRISRAAAEFETTLDEENRPRDGRLALSGVEIEDAAELARVTPLTLTGEGDVEDGVLSARFAAESQSGPTVLEITLDHDFDSGAGALAATTPRFAFDPDGLQPSAISPALLGPVVNVEGGAQVRARLGWSANGLEGDATATLDDIGFGTRFGRFEGLSTEFEIADLLALKTDQPQTITIGLVDPGVPLTDGRLQVELLGGLRMGVVSGRFPFAGGEILAEPGVVDWSQDEQRFVLRARGISLDALDVQYNPPNLDITGTLSGLIPIVAHGRVVEIVGGELVSDEPGRLSYTGRAAEGVASQNESTQLAFDALKNFYYDRMVLTMNGDVAGDLVTGVRLEGRNPDVLEGYPINFNLTTMADLPNLLTGAFLSFGLLAGGLSGLEDVINAATAGAAEASGEGDN